MLSLPIRRIMYAMMATALLFSFLKPADPVGAAVVFSGFVTWLVMKCY